METMTTKMLQQGRTACRARVVSSWRGVSAYLGCGGTGLLPVSNSCSVNGFSGNTTDTTEPAGTARGHHMATKRPARHLGTRST